MTFKFSDSYIKKVREIVNGDALGFIEDWKETIAWFYHGYDRTRWEYDDDFGFRDTTENLINNKSLYEFPDHKEFIRQIKELDELFIKISFPLTEDLSYSKYWFENRILKYAGEDYRDSFDSECYREIHEKIKPIEFIVVDLKEEYKLVKSWGIKII